MQVQSLSSYRAAKQVLARLLSAFFHPAAAAAPALGQTLSIFFPAFAALGPQSRELLGLAALPAAQQAMTEAQGLAGSKNPAPRLLLYVLQQLQVPMPNLSTYMQVLSP